MTELRDCTDPSGWAASLEAARRAIDAGELIVFATDTVYGIAAEAFNPAAVQALFDAKGRTRQMPPPVLIADVATMDGLAADILAEARALALEFWPGPLTLILTAQPSLAWDLGDTNGTVALRVPHHPFAQVLLHKTGPLAVSSANLTGNPPALTVADAAVQLTESVAVYLDSGPTLGQVPSTIVDATGPVLRIVRDGALTREELAAIAPSLRGADSA